MGVPLHLLSKLYSQGSQGFFLYFLLIRTCGGSTSDLFVTRWTILSFRRGRWDSAAVGSRYVVVSGYLAGNKTSHLRNASTNTSFQHILTINQVNAHSIYRGNALLKIHHHTSPHLPHQYILETIHFILFRWGESKEEQRTLSLP